MSSTPSRRRVLQLIGLGAAGATFGSPSRSLARQPPATAPADAPAMQGAGFFTFPLADANVSVISDGGFVMRPAETFPNVPPDELRRVADAVHVSTEGYPAQISTLLVRRGGDVVLIDTGAGQNFGPTAGQLIPNLARAGVRPAEVTHVVLSHAHPDHVGGLLARDGSPAFPKARVFANRAEHDFWTGSDPQIPGALVSADFKKMVIAAAGRAFAGVKASLELVAPGDPIAGLVTMVDAAGHTPGHVALRVGSAGGPQLLFLGDALFIPLLQLRHPEWHAAYDADPDRAVDARRVLLALAAKERLLTSGGHAPFPSLGYVDADGDAYRWTPMPWSW